MLVKGSLFEEKIPLCIQLCPMRSIGKTLFLNKLCECGIHSLKLDWLGEGSIGVDLVYALVVEVV